MDLTRRTFLLGTGAAAAQVIAAPSTASAGAPAKAATPYATLLELDKCVGCGSCVDACRERNAARYPRVTAPMPDLMPPGTKTEDWSQRQEVNDRLTPYNWLYIQTVDVEEGGAHRELHIPRRCMHCVNPPCVNMCPWGSCQLTVETGTVRIDPEACLGGAKCRSVCPWHIPQRQSGVGLYLQLMPRFAGNGVMYKCDRCADSFAAGVLPACIEACPEGVQSIGPREEILAKARALAKERGHYLYGVDDNGGTNTFYLSPVPIAALAAKAEPGRPDLAPKANSMAQAGNLWRALLVAPLAGVAAGYVGQMREAASPVVSGGPTSSRWIKRLWVALALALGFTGMMQMPVAGRYGLNKLPLLGWTGDFYASLSAHLALSVVLLVVGGWLAVRWWRGRSGTLTASGKLRLTLLAATLLTGMVCAAKLTPWLAIGPLWGVVWDLAHLGSCVLLGLAGLYALVRGKPWTRSR